MKKKRIRSWVRKKFEEILTINQELDATKSYKFIGEKGISKDFYIRMNGENISRIFVLLKSTSENFEVFVSRRHLKEKKIDFSFKTNRFFIKYPSFTDLSRVFLAFMPNERMKYEISIKFITGLLII